MSGFCPVLRAPCDRSCGDDCERSRDRQSVERKSRAVLATILTDPVQLDTWLWTPNERLGWQLPRDCIREGRLDEILQAARDGA